MENGIEAVITACLERATHIRELAGKMRYGTSMLVSQPLLLKFQASPP